MINPQNNIFIALPLIKKTSAKLCSIPMYHEHEHISIKEKKKEKRSMVWLKGKILETKTTHRKFKTIIIVC